MRIARGPTMSEHLEATGLLGVHGRRDNGGGLKCLCTNTFPGADLFTAGGRAGAEVVLAEDCGQTSRTGRCAANQPTITGDHR